MTRSLATTVTALALGLAVSAGQPYEHTVALEEHLGVGWGEALVHREIVVPQRGLLWPDRVALYEGSQPMRVQLDRVQQYEDGSVRRADAWFRSDLPAKAKRTLVLRGTRSAGSQPTDLRLVRRGNVLEISNSMTAVRLPAGRWQTPDDARGPADIAAALAKHLGLPDDPPDLPGPLLGVRLASGQWTGAACLSQKESFEFEIAVIQPIPEVAAGAFQSYETKVLAEGPLFYRVRVSYRFAGRGEYVMQITLRSQEPLVRIDERYHHAGAVTFELGQSLKPTAAHYLSNGVRPGKGRLSIDYDQSGLVGLFLGWDGYYRRVAPAFLLTGDPSGQCLGLVSIDPDWLPFPYNQALHVATTPDRGLVAKASLTKGQRHWAIFVGKSADFPAPDHDFYRWWYRHVAFPLDKIANWELVWPGMMDLEFPHTFFDKQELPSIRARLQANEVIAEFIKTVRPRQRRTLTDAATVALFSGDPADLAILKEVFTKDSYLDRLPPAFLQEPGMFRNNSLNYMQITDELLKRYVGLELVLGSGLLSPDERKHCLTLISFATHLMDDLMFWPPNHPFNPHKDEFYPVYVQGTPNQKTCYITGRGMSACMIRNHPRFPQWMGRALAEFDRVVSDAVAPSGAHLESPFYSARDTMRFGPFWTAVTRAGVGGVQVERWGPRLKRCYEYLTHMLTPREPRMGGRRVYHPVGRSSPGVVDPTMMIGAEPFGRDDPDLKRRLRWCWEEQGRPSPYIMGNTGGRDMSLTILAFSQIADVRPCDAPPLRSVRYEGMGAIFRSQVGTEFESNVLFRHDPFSWNLYEGNNGAVYFYGKGVPLLVRFGAYWGRQQGQPNLMSIPFGNRVVFEKGESVEWTDALGNMTEFASLGEVADLASGVTRDQHWRRSVLFAKDLTRDDPVYLLVRDDVHRPGSGSALHWWVMSKAVQPDGIAKPGVVPTKGSDNAWMANLGKNWKEAPKLRGQSHTFEGHFGVQLDLFLAAPAQPRIVTDAVGVGPRMPYCVNPKLYEYQQLIRIEQPEGRGYLTLLSPRWPSEALREYRTLPGGIGVAIKHSAGEDRLFLNAEAVEYRDSTVELKARCGFVRRGPGEHLRLTVVEGQIEAAGIRLTSPAAAALICDGEKLRAFTTGKRDQVKIVLPERLKGLPVSVEEVE